MISEAETILCYIRLKDLRVSLTGSAHTQLYVRSRRRDNAEKNSYLVRTR